MRKTLKNPTGPDYTLRPGERWVWVKTYSGKCRQTLVLANGKLDEFPYNLEDAVLCTDAAHHHGETTL